MGDNTNHSRNKATLSLIKTDSGDYYLQGDGDHSRNTNFSIYALDGEGGDPFSFASGEKWAIVELPGIPKGGVKYDPDDQDSFWGAQAKVVKAARKAGIQVPDYA